MIIFFIYFFLYESFCVQGIVSYMKPETREYCFVKVYSDFNKIKYDIRFKTEVSWHLIGTSQTPSFEETL